MALSWEAEIQGAPIAVSLHFGNDCPDGLEKIFDEARCTDAAKLLDAEVATLRGREGKPPVHTETDEEFPKGCYRCVNTHGCKQVSGRPQIIRSHMKACMTATWPACRMEHI